MQKLQLTPAKRLIVAADFTPPEELSPFQAIEWVRGQVLRLADDLAGKGCYLKVNSALRAVGYPLLREIQHRGLLRFADLKLVDISATLETDGAFLRLFAPELLTVMCNAHTDGMSALKKALSPATEVLGVTVLTTFKDAQCADVYAADVRSAVIELARLADAAGIGGLVSSGKEAPYIINEFGNNRFTLNVANIRPDWANVMGDDQAASRKMTPSEALAAGVTRIVVGRPITQAKNRKEAVDRTIAEIATALAA